MFKYKTNDTVQITSGKDKGTSGQILKVFPALNQVVVDGKNTYKRHLKPRGKEAGEVVTLSRPLDVAKIALLCPTCKKPTRVGLEGAGKTKVRICKKCHSVISFAKKPS